MEEVFKQHPELAVWLLSICGSLITILTGSIIFMAKKKFKKVDDLIESLTDLKIAVISSEGRIKEYIAEKFVTKEVCEALHSRTLKEVKETINGGKEKK